MISILKKRKHGKQLKISDLKCGYLGQFTNSPFKNCFILLNQEQN